MPTLNRPRSAILSLIPVPQSLAHLEAMELAWPLDVQVPVQDLSCEVLVAPVEILLTDAFLRLWKSLRQKNVGTQLIVVADSNTPSEFIVESQKELPLFRLYESLEEPDLEWGLFEAIEKSSLLKQNEQLHVLVQDQTEKLKSLYHELEERVQKRQRYLEESRRKSLIAQFRWQTLKQATEIILEAGSVLEMERALTQVLQEALNLIQVRILLRQQSSLAQTDRGEPKIAIHRVRLFQDNDVLLGYSVFMRDEAWPFSLEEKDFLHKISEAISLAIRRLNQVEITRTLREQWAATFNAITEPVALVRENFDIVQSNTAFQQRFKDSAMPRVPLGQFVRTEPTRQRPESWEISSQPMSLTPNDSPQEPLYFMQFHEITERLRIERKLLEGARLAELGIIGSSIAHELNNPLGGILSFVQMMKMDLPKDHPLLPDVEEMETGVFRCRDIVQNLLGFTRSSEMDEKKNFDIREALTRAISILELQTRSAGLEIRRQLPEKAQFVHGHSNLISQAFANLLQNSLQNLAATPGKSQPQLEVLMTDQGSEVEIRIIDNAPALNNSMNNSPTGAAPTLSLPLAQQIFLDHDAGFEILLPGRGLRLVKISVPKASLTDLQ